MSDISVVIPAYNHVNYISDAVKSVVNQSVKAAEIVIIDDGSTDATLEVCKKLCEKYPEIRLIEQENQGAHNAINRGIDEAVGKYIAILNSDDVFLQDKLKTCNELLKDKPETDLILHSVNFFDENSRDLKTGITVDWHKRAWKFYKESQLLGLSLLNENFVVTTSNMVFTKKVWAKAEKFQPLRYCHDLEFLLAVIRNSTEVVVEERSFVRYRVHPSNTIKEQVQRVRVEIAAVIAHSIVEDNTECFGDTDSLQSVEFFRKFLRNKNLSDLVLYLAMTYLNSDNKTVFYNNVLPDSTKDLYSNLLD